MTKQPEGKRRLGRGLSSLLGVSRREEAEDLQLKQIDIDLIQPNPFQPRKDFDEEGIIDLSQSIRQHGFVQPLAVRPIENGFQLIAGERRLLAAKKLKLKCVPCQIMEMEDQNVSEAAIEENLKRKDLNVLEKAQAFQAYLDRFACTIETLAKRLSMTRSNVSNMLRLLDLAEEVKSALRNDKIKFGHGRALLPLPHNDQIELLERITSNTMSVRETESAVREKQRSNQPDQPASPNASTSKNADVEPTNHVLSLQDQLQKALGIKVEIRLTSPESGKLVLHFTNNDEFEALLKRLRQPPSSDSTPAAA